MQSKSSRILSFMSSKGGVGKTTLSIQVGYELFKRGHTVVILDGDYNQDSSVYISKLNVQNLTSVSNINEDNILDHVENAMNDKKNYIIIDTPGGHSRLSMMAISISDFIGIPSRKTSPDFRNALKTIKDIRQLEKANMRHGDIRYNYSLIWNDISTQFETQTIKEINEIVSEKNIPILTSALMRRTAFDDCQSRNISIYDMFEKTKKDKYKSSILNIRILTDEIISKLSS